MERILIITNRLLGDGLDSFPALEFIFRHLLTSNFSDQSGKSRKRQIDLFSYRYTQPLYHNFPFHRKMLIDHRRDYLDRKLSPIHSIKRLYQLSRKLRGYYTVVIIFPGGFGWALWARLLRPRFVVGASCDYRWPLLTHRVSYSRRRPNYENFLLVGKKAVSLFTPRKERMVKSLKENDLAEMDKIKKHLPKLIPTHPPDQWKKKILAQLNRSNHRNSFKKVDQPVKSSAKKKSLNKTIFNRYVVIAPTASEESRMWKKERFQYIAKKISDRGYTVFWVGLKKEYQFIESLAQKKLGYNIAGALELTEVFSLIAHSRGFLGSDSGLAHVATMLGVTTVIIYGPANPTLSQPFFSLPSLSKSADSNMNNGKSRVAQKKPIPSPRLYQIYHDHSDIPHERRREKIFQKVLDVNRVTAESVWEKIESSFPNKK